MKEIHLIKRIKAVGADVFDLSDLNSSLDLIRLGSSWSSYDKKKESSQLLLCDIDDSVVAIY